MVKYKWATALSLALIGAMFIVGLWLDLSGNKTLTQPKEENSQAVKMARVVANGDILYHDILYTSARQPDGSYDFNPYFNYVREWISGADLAIGDFEGTISPDFPLAGYPLFNAPVETAEAMKTTGYDVVDLAHNHILDSHLSGALNTKQVFNNLGLDTVGIYGQGREEDGLLIKEVNGIKIAILGYAYGYNGMESLLTEKEYQRHMADLDRKKIKADLKAAEKLADVTIVLPQMGVEYALQPSDEQISLYHEMIDWGADVIFGGHPHVIQPAETLQKDGEDKLIIYSMGNFISNQRLETLDNIWTERGVLMDVTFEKSGQKTKIKTAQARPTLVWSWGKGVYGYEGYEYRDYRVLVLEDFIEGGRFRQDLPEEMLERVDTAYAEIKAHVDLEWQP